MTIEQDKLKSIMDEGERFAAQHLAAGAAELRRWRKTTILEDGVVRQLARHLEQVYETNALNLAERMFEKAALDAAAKPKTRQAVTGQQDQDAKAYINAMNRELGEAFSAIDRAKPGPVELHTSCSWRRIMAHDAPWLVPCMDHDGHPNMDGYDEAEAAVAAYNFLFRRRELLSMVMTKAGHWEAFCTAAEQGEDLTAILEDARNMGAGVLELHFSGNRAPG